MSRNSYFKEDIPMADFAINFYTLYSLLVLSLIDFVEAEFLNIKHSSETMFK